MKRKVLERRARSPPYIRTITLSRTPKPDRRSHSGGHWLDAQQDATLSLWDATLALRDATLALSYTARHATKLSPICSSTICISGQQQKLSPIRSSTVCISGQQQ